MQQLDLLPKDKPAVDAKPDPALVKAPGAFKTISEVAESLDVPQHVLRFWESRFSQIKPLKLRGGRRYYRPEDVTILTTIKNLLYKQGYTIKGAKKAFSQKKQPVFTAAPAPAAKAEAKRPDAGRQQKLSALHKELLTMRDELKPFIA